MRTDQFISYFALAGIIIAMTTDIPRNKIYNWLTLPLMASGPVIQLWRHGLPGLGSSVLGFLGVSIILFLLFRLIGRGIGGGDIKLLVALGAILGWPDAGWFLLYTALTGPLLILPVMVARGIFTQTLQNLLLNLYLRRTGDSRLSVAANSCGPKLPFAVCALTGLLTLILWGP